MYVQCIYIYTYIYTHLHFLARYRDRHRDRYSYRYASLYPSNIQIHTYVTPFQVPRAESLSKIPDLRKITRANPKPKP